MKNFISIMLALMVAYQGIAFGQLPITATPLLQQVGATHPIILPDGRILMGVDSKTSESSVQRIDVTTPIEVTKIRARHDLDSEGEMFLVPFLCSNTTQTYLLVAPGRYKIECYANNSYGETEWLTNGPYVPKPDPKPDDPKPDPNKPAPIDGVGLRVMMVYESASDEALSLGHKRVLYGVKFRKFLSENCVKDVDGKSSEWRFIDKDTQYTDATNRWVKALTRPRATTPWIVVSNGVTGYEGPLPESETEAIELVSKYK